MKSNVFSIFSIITIPLLLEACAQPSFNVKSEPSQASVYILNEKQEKKLLGKTPIAMPNADLKKYTGSGVTSGEYFSVMIEKDGFLPQTLSVPAARFGTLITTLDVKLKQGEAPQEIRLAKEILDHLFLAQKMANASQFERAQIELDKILQPFPKFSRALSMRGSIYYAQKNYSESIKWYEEALKQEPQLEEAFLMLPKAKAHLSSPNGQEGLQKQ